MRGESFWSALLKHKKQEEAGVVRVAIRATRKRRCEELTRLQWPSSRVDHRSHMTTLPSIGSFEVSAIAGTYILKKSIGQGVYGQVFLGEHSGNGASVAIKVCPTPSLNVGACGHVFGF